MKRALYAICCALFVLGCNEDSPPRPVAPGSWFNQYGQVTVDAAGNFTFGEPHYVVKAAPPLSAGQTMSIRFSIVGQAGLAPTDSAPPARLRLYIQQAGDNSSCAGDFQHYRIWSHDVIITAPGEFTLSANLIASDWTDCYAQHLTPERFATLLSNPVVVGFTFGGDFAGHGVRATAPVYFVLREFKVM